MKSSRLEAFSDGVLAIIITIMVLELKAPEDISWASISKLLPTFISYVISFIYVGIYWNSHHHLFQIIDKINGKVLWANLHLLFWLSLIPFATSWIGENHMEALPTAFYGFILLMSAISSFILKKILIATHEEESIFIKSMQNLKREYFSIFFYCIGIILAFYLPYFAIFIFILIGAMWFIPDNRIEKFFK